MGNAHSGSTFTRTTAALDSFVAELGSDIIYDKSLGSARFLKTVKCRHRNSYLVVKVFIKPDPGLSLRNYHRRLKADREALTDIANVYNYQSFVETERAGYIVRQWIASSLYDRISTRPFLSIIEKKWITFQLLNALRDARNRKVSHGDIKSENILVTSWNWVYLSDFASYKPTYLPLEDPSDFSFYFDTSGRRICYIAPERFYTAANNPDISAKKSKLDETEGKRDGKVTEAMDCFSAGCVIAELFLEGAPLFTLSQLFNYRDGQYNVDSYLAPIEDEGIRNVIKQMISLEPSARPTFDTLLHTSRGSVLPESFYSFLHNYVSSVNDLPSNPPFSNTTSSTQTPGPLTPTVSGTNLRSNSSLNPNPTAVIESSTDVLPSDSDHRMERIWADYESVETYLIPESAEETVMDVKVEYNSTIGMSRPFQDILPIEIHIPNRESKLRGTLNQGLRASEDGPALIILALVTANVRNCALPSSKVQALDVFLALASHLTDEAKLDRMLPYIVELLHDDSATVRSAAMRTMVQVLMMVTVITPSNALIFPEYILPNIKYVVQDPEVSVRCTYAQCIVHLADTAVRYLEMGQALKAHGTFKLAPEAVAQQEYDNARFEVSYDASMQDLQNNIQEHLSALLMDSSSVVKRSVLHNISSMCVFLGWQKTNDVVLSHMITYLNDRDWLLRYAFFESIVDVVACAGGRSLEEYILPLMIQALSGIDVEETVVAKVLVALTSLCELGLFKKMRIWELMTNTLGFLYHPNVWIRQGAAAFIVCATSHLPESDAWCIIYPSLRHFLKSDIVTLDEQSLLSAMKPPLSRQVFDAAVQWAMKSDKSSFWRGQRRVPSRNESPRESVLSLRKTGTVSRGPKSDEDDAQFAKLQQLGMTSTEEVKLLAMREYIIRLANATSSFASRVSFEPEADKNLKSIGDIELPKLGVVPQTVFLKSRSSDFGNRRLSHARRTSALTTPLLSPNRMSDHGSIAPFEDLRRRLATINGSSSSIILSPPRNATMSPSLSISSAAAVAVGAPSPIERPVSPTDSVVSTTNSTTFRPLSRMQLGGTTDSQKAAPAVGSSKTNAIGLLDGRVKLRSDGSPERSGTTSPLSMSTTTIRGPTRSRVPSLQPISTYDGQEAGISNLLENLYLDNNRELQNDFGPNVHEGPVRRRNAVRHTFQAREGAKHTEATLVSHLTSHSDAINGLAVSPDHMFFVSASDDKTVKVWDTARLERNVTTKPRHTYGQHHAKVKCVCMLEGVHCFASAADDGSLHIVRVHVTQTGSLPKYNKLQVIRGHQVEHAAQGEFITCMTHYNTDSGSHLVYATTHSNITILDLRTMDVVQTMENPRHHGPITCLCIDRRRSWIVVGTSTGVLTLWDRRFGLLLKSWHVGVASTGRFVRIRQCVVHPSKGRGKWVMVTVEGSRKNDRTFTNLVEVWDIEKALLVETFVARQSGEETLAEPHELTGVDADMTPAAAIAALVTSRQAIPPDPSQSTFHDELLPPPSADVRALVVGVDFGGHVGVHRSDLAEGVEAGGHGRRGFMISGSEDRKLRLWDLAKLDRTTVLSGLDSEAERPTYTSFSSTTASTYVETWADPATTASQSNRPAQRMSLITHTQQNLLKAHQDVITALACIDSPFRAGVVSGDRAGVIKVWRVELS
ncbi:hypothetical protein MIND_01191800 [Mycena indigotica]|uniref:non-specific serine/threonine protein kinase n=1 Tax=Mycena indigotica TaxID=2126181 RepID=A0A8H6S5R9_9AGAR|nr:uncharacterized protein MIND_01191800 [Mycena indigotica]KAF7292927.1 hypothetical protein MIND_01191800 [Mycena indigotica]